MQMCREVEGLMISPVNDRDLTCDLLIEELPGEETLSTHVGWPLLWNLYLQNVA